MPFIGIVSNDYHYLTEEGLTMGLSAITYNGEEFLIEGHTEWSGSVYDEDPELVKTFKSCGIPINWNALLSDDPIQQILNTVNGTRLFDIETKVFEPTGVIQNFLVVMLCIRVILPIVLPILMIQQ